MFSDIFKFYLMMNHKEYPTLPNFPSFFGALLR